MERYDFRKSNYVSMSYKVDDEYAHLQEYPWSGINLKLFQAYNAYCTKLYELNFFESHEEYELPYFIAVSKNYEAAQHRIMVIAQETIEWGESEFRHNNGYHPINPTGFEVKDYVEILKRLKYPDEIISALMILYDERVNREWGVGGLLWRFYNNLREELEQQPPFKFGLIHNNIAKIANRGGKNVGGNRSDHPLNKELVSLINDEIGITDPDIIIFCIGNDKHYVDYAKILCPEIDNLTKTLSQSNRVSSMTEYEIGGRKRYIVCCNHPHNLNFVKGGLETSTDKIISLITKIY